MQIQRNSTLRDLLNNESSTVNGCHQNESSNSLQKHHNNPENIRIEIYTVQALFIYENINGSKLICCCILM